MIARLAILIAAFTVAACGTEAPKLELSERPKRVVSLDYCADQYVLKLADPEQILAVSPNATKSFSYMRENALGMPTVRPSAEDVLALKPDLVVRSYGGGPNIVGFLERAGVPVLQVSWATKLDGDEAGAIPTIIKHMSIGLGQPDRGQNLIVEFRSRLSALKANAASGNVLYMTPSGATTGPASLVHEMFVAAGLENYETEPGWRPLPLERLTYSKPDRVAAAFYESRQNQFHTWSASNHPVARDLLAQSTSIPLHGAWTACGGWFVLDAVEALAAGDAQ